MKDLEMKDKILQEIMDVMDQREGDNLKTHPKLMAAKVEVEKPGEDIGSLLDGSSSDDVKEGSPEEEASESPAMEAKEDSGEVTPEQLQKLLEHFKGL